MFTGILWWIAEDAGEVGIFAHQIVQADGVLENVVKQPNGQYDVIFSIEKDTAVSLGWVESHTSDEWLVPEVS